MRGSALFRDLMQCVLAQSPFHFIRNIRVATSDFREPGNEQHKAAWQGRGRYSNAYSRVVRGFPVAKWPTLNCSFKVSSISSWPMNVFSLGCGFMFEENTPKKPNGKQMNKSQRKRFRE